MINIYNNFTQYMLVGSWIKVGKYFFIKALKHPNVSIYIFRSLSILLHGVISLPDTTSYDKLLFSRLTQLSIKSIMLINVKLPTIVSILTFISMINSMSMPTSIGI